LRNNHGQIAAGGGRCAANQRQLRVDIVVNEESRRSGACRGRPRFARQRFLRASRIKDGASTVPKGILVGKEFQANREQASQFAADFEYHRDSRGVAERAPLRRSWRYATHRENEGVQFEAGNAGKWRNLHANDERIRHRSRRAPADTKIPRSRPCSKRNTSETWGLPGPEMRFAPNQRAMRTQRRANRGKPNVAIRQRRFLRAFTNLPAGE